MAGYFEQGKKSYMSRNDIGYSCFGQFYLSEANNYGTVGYLPSNYQGHSQMPLISSGQARTGVGGRAYHYFDYPGDGSWGGDDDFYFNFTALFDDLLIDVALKPKNIYAYFIVEALDSDGDKAEAKINQLNNWGSVAGVAYLKRSENDDGWVQWHSGWKEISYSKGIEVKLYSVDGGGSGANDAELMMARVILLDNSRPALLSVEVDSIVSGGTTNKNSNYSNVDRTRAKAGTTVKYKVVFDEPVRCTDPSKPELIIESNSPNKSIKAKLSTANVKDPHYSRTFYFDYTLQEGDNVVVSGSPLKLVPNGGFDDIGKNKAIDFGGKVSVPLKSPKKGDASGGNAATPPPSATPIPGMPPQPGNPPPKPGDQPPSGLPPQPVNPPPQPPKPAPTQKEKVKAFANEHDDKINAFDGNFSASVDSVLFGERPDKEPGFTGEKTYMGFGLGARAISTTNQEYAPADGMASPYKLLAQGANKNEYEFIVLDEIANNKGQYIALWIDYDKGKLPPFIANDPSGNPYTLIPFERSKSQEWNNNNGANLVCMSEGEKDFAYITIPANKMQAGTWKITATDDTEIAGSYFTIPLPAAITNLSSSYENSRFTITDFNMNGNDDAKLNLALVPVQQDSNGNPLKDSSGKYLPLKETLKNADGSPIMEQYTDSEGNQKLRPVEVEHVGYSIKEGIEKDAIKGTYNIPDSIASGKYLMKLEALSLNSSIYTSIFAEPLIEFVNPNQLAIPTSLSLKPVGDGGLQLDADIDNRASGAICTIYERIITGYENGAPKYGERPLKGVGGYIAAETNDIGGKSVSGILKGKVTLIDENGIPYETDGFTPGNSYNFYLSAVDANENSAYLSSDLASLNEYVEIPIPNPPVLDVKITERGSGAALIEKIDDITGYKHLKSKDDDFRLVYTILNPDNISPFATEIYIDNMKLGSTLINTDETGYVGYADFSISDGEHYVQVVSKNKDGDKSIYSEKIVIDSKAPDLKLESPKMGGLIDPSQGILISGQTELGAKITVSIDGGAEYVVPDTLIKQTGRFEVTRPVLNKNKMEYDVLIKCEDSSGHATQALVRVSNAKLSEVSGIDIVGNQVQGTKVVLLYANALDKEGDILFKVPKELLEWEFIGDDGNATFDARLNEDAILAYTSDYYDYAVSASWRLSEGYRITDVFSWSKSREIKEPKPKPTPEPTPTPDPEPTLSIYSKVRDSFKKEMSKSAIIWAIPIYAAIDNDLYLNDVQVNVPMNEITGNELDYMVLARDPDTSSYSSTLQEGMNFVSDIVQFQPIKQKNAQPGNYTVTIPYDPKKVSDIMSVSVYAYSDELQKWVRIVSEIDPINNVVNFQSPYYGRFAVVEDSRTIGFKDVNNMMWSNSRIKALSPVSNFDHWHIYSLVWEEDRIMWYVDGKFYNAMTKDEWWSFADLSSPTAPFDQAFYPIINLALGGRFDNVRVDQKIFNDGQTEPLQIDYVRVYKPVGDTSEPIR